MKTSKLPKRRENANDQIAIVFGFAFDKLRAGCIAKLSKTEVISDYFPYSIENCSIRTWCLCRRESLLFKYQKMLKVYEVKSYRHYEMFGEMRAP